MAIVAFRARYILPITLLVGSFACSSAPDFSGDADGGGLGADGGPPPGLCTQCVIDSDCSNGATCAQFSGDSFCAAACPNGNECGTGTTCTLESSVAGDPVHVCVPNGNACGAAPPPHKPPGDAGSGDSALPPPFDAGGPVQASINANGGTESKLYFAIIGDTRPPVIDDTKAYPTATITKIFSDINALNPMPPFAVATGDYQFSSSYGAEAPKQFALYTQARSKYAGIEFPAMGNHECTGATTSNCATTITNNYTAFMSAMLAPIQKTKPYYSINVAATDSSWTAKFVFVAANAWDSTQANWLDTTLSASTTYTFVIRHESNTASTAPGVTPSKQIMANHPLTLLIVGHEHTYSRPAQNEVLFGNGGAPLVNASTYGFGLITQRQDKAIQVDSIDMNTGSPDLQFRFAVKPDGSPAP
jgi:hypothetical protein